MFAQYINKLALLPLNSFYAERFYLSWCDSESDSPSCFLLLKHQTFIKCNDSQATVAVTSLLCRLCWLAGRVNWFQGWKMCPEKLKDLRKSILQDLIMLHLLVHSLDDFTRQQGLPVLNRKGRGTLKDWEVLRTENEHPQNMVKAKSSFFRENCPWVVLPKQV